MTTATDTLNVLLIEDDEDDYLITRSLLSKAQVIDCDLEWVASYEEGLEAVLSNQYDACLVDYRLGAKTGLDLLQEAKAHGCRTPIILLTGQGDLKVDIEAMEAGAADYLNKNEIDPPLLERSLRYARERGEAEERIRKQAALLDKARDAIIAYDMDGRVIYWNKSAERLTGWSKEEMLGEKARERLYEHDQDGALGDCWETMMASGEWKGELHQQTKDGDEIVVESRWTLVRETDGTPESVLVINTDITERKRLESQFLRSQRMESIGRLVSGIAHDLGNLLVPISLGVKVLQQRFSDDEKASRTLSVIQNSAERGSDMVDQVLAFARGVEGERVALQLNTIIDDVQNITEETFPEEVDVEVAVEEDLQQIVGDATQIQQVLMNLCVNARDAMPNGGTLTVEARNVDFTEREARRNIEAEPGDYVCIEVRDTGTGMPDDVADKIFEPFFTTKEEGEGTGLGLSTAYSIIQSHDGFMDVESEEGEGTTFWIYLPAADEDVTVEAQSTTNGEAEHERPSFDGSGTQVLVVDDEEFVLESAQQTLEATGYTVRTALDAAAALRVVEKEAIDLVITDLRMPEMSGLDLIRRLRKQDRSLPIVAASGVADGRTEEALDAGAQTFLAKPFTAENLEAALQEALHTSEEAAARQE